MRWWMALGLVRCFWILLFAELYFISCRTNVKSLLSQVSQVLRGALLCGCVLLGAILSLSSLETLQQAAALLEDQARVASPTSSVSRP